MFKPVLVGVALASAALCAQAGVTASVGQLAGSFMALSSANVSGGALYSYSENHGSQDVPGATESGNYAAQPWAGGAQLVTTGNWLASGPSSNSNNGGGDAKLSLGTGMTAVSFLWGSPDYYNSFVVTLADSSTHTFGTWTGSSSTWLGLTLNGDQKVASYITFTADAGATISSITFQSPGANAIEIANVTAVPEPEAYGLALAGLGVVGFAMRRRVKR